MAVMLVHLGISCQVNCADSLTVFWSVLVWGIWEWIKMTLDCSFQASLEILRFLGRNGLTWICASFLWKEGGIRNCDRGRGTRRTGYDGGNGDFVGS